MNYEGTGRWSLRNPRDYDRLEMYLKWGKQDKCADF
jgi:hypothetical protein